MEKDIISELAFKVKNGDKQAFEELYKLTSSKAYFTALKITGDKHEAEDIVQESYITVLAKINTLEKTEVFMSWFNRIVANKSKDYLRKKNPSFFADGEESNIADTFDEQFSFLPESAVDRNELREEVMSAFDELNDEKRVCVLMKYFEDMSVNDIADSMGISVSTVKNRLFAARKELKAVFEKRGIVATYSVAPFGVVAWALNSSFETVAQGFESGVNAKILSAIAVAGTATATAAGAGAGATAGTGVAAKVAAATTLQKIIASIAVVGVVTGSTLGITNMFNDKAEEEQEPTNSYNETVVEPEKPIIESIEIDEGQEPDEPINVADSLTNEEKNDDERLQINVSADEKEFFYKLKYVGELKLGKNTVNLVWDYVDNVFYADFYAPETGYYAFSQNRHTKKLFGGVAFWEWNLVVDVPSIGADGSVSMSPFNSLEIGNGADNYCLVFLEKGAHHPYIALTDKNITSYDMTVEYLGDEITGMGFPDGLPKVVLNYNENYDIVDYDGTDYIYDKNHFSYEWIDVDVSFSSGKTLHLENAAIDGTVNGGFKEGKNAVTLFLFDYKQNETVEACRIEDYVKHIEITNLEDFLFVEVGSEYTYTEPANDMRYTTYGLKYSKPEEYELIVTYADGEKETFDGTDWDRVLRFDDGTELYVVFGGTQLGEDEAARFFVCIGDNVYINELCTVTKFNPLGIMLRGPFYNWFYNTFNGHPMTSIAYEQLIEARNLEELTANLKNFAVGIEYDIKKTNSQLKRDIENANVTLYKICTENEFDLV